MNLSSKLVSLGAALVVALSPLAAAAAPGDAAAAEALFREGRRLLDAGDAAAACPKLEESQRLDPGAGTQFFLASCYEAVGRTASAWATFREVESASRSAGRKDRADLAATRASALEPKLCRLRIDVASATPGLEVRRADAVVGSGQWGVALPVDPGTIVVRASAPGHVTVTLQAVVRDPGSTVVVSVPPLATSSTPGDAASPASRSPLPTAGWIAIGVGGAALVASGIVGLVAKSKYDDAGCAANGACKDTASVELTRDAGSLADVGTVLLVSGAVVAVAGVVMVLVAPKSHPATVGSMLGEVRF
ncbi:MAG: hypothetical protein JST00_25995 [Deltaproteobacteria bacterium]|nr:hypothetical protein [Deltaproteobacteria bacterium]